MFDAALYLYRLGGFVTETFNEIFGILYLFLLIFVSAELLFAAFFTELYKLVVLYLIIIDTSTGNLNGTSGDVVQESTVMADEYHCVGTGRKEILQPLDAFYVEVVCRLIE